MAAALPGATWLRDCRPPHPCHPPYVTSPHPTQQGVRWVFSGMWTLGGAYVVWRVAAGTLARVTGMLGRNARRKRDLAAKLEVVEVRDESSLLWCWVWGQPMSLAACSMLLPGHGKAAALMPAVPSALAPQHTTPCQGVPPAPVPAPQGRIHIMASLLNWAEARKSPFPSPSPSHEGPLQQLAQQAQQAAARQGPPAPPGEAAAAAGPARSAGSSSPELVPAPPRVLVGRSSEGTPSFGTPTHSRSPSHSPPKAQRSAAAGSAAAGAGAGTDSMAPGAATPLTGGPGGPGSAASLSTSGGSGGRLACGSSPSRPDLSTEMESLMRYAQLGSAGRGGSPSGTSSSASRLVTP